MQKNSLISLNDILFEELEKLSDDEDMADPDKAKAEIERAKAIQGVASIAVKNVSNVIKAKAIQCRYGETEFNGILALGNEKAAK